MNEILSPFQCRKQRRYAAIGNDYTSVGNVGIEKSIPEEYKEEY